MNWKRASETNLWSLRVADVGEMPDLAAHCMWWVGSSSPAESRACRNSRARGAPSKGQPGGRPPLQRRRASVKRRYRTRSSFGAAVSRSLTVSEPREAATRSTR
eukprot:7808398-Lingulodinium_polyedra.AAC.1